MVLQKGDFIEIEFTGRISLTGEIFDTNIKEDAKKANFNEKDIKPFILSIGHRMLPQGFDDNLLGKEIGKEYSVELRPEEAFGKREPKLIRMIPTKLFLEQKINPERGMQLALDGQIAKVLSNSGGRTLVDFNNPLAGKKVIYNYKILRKVTDETEKINALQDFFFKKRFEFKKENNKILFKVSPEEEPLVKIFSKKLKEILSLEIETSTKKEQKEEDKSTIH